MVTVGDERRESERFVTRIPPDHLNGLEQVFQNRLHVFRSLPTAQLYPYTQERSYLHSCSSFRQQRGTAPAIRAKTAPPPLHN